MVLCSATFSEHIRKFAMRSLRANLEVISTVEADAAKAHLEVAQPVDQAGACEPKRVLVIFPTVRWLQFFYVLLKHRANMPGLLALHRSLADDRRRSRAFRFSRGAPATMGALFATDVAARGMDFDVHTVIQVGPPEDREQYVHRAGRTGRPERVRD
eukprot:g7548.t1